MSSSACVLSGGVLHEARASCCEDIFLPRCTDCSGHTALTLQSPRRESKAWQPAQLITPPLSHSGQRVSAEESKGTKGACDAAAFKSRKNCGRHFIPSHPFDRVMSFITCNVVTLPPRIHLRSFNIFAIPQESLSHFVNQM